MLSVHKKYATLFICLFSHSLLLNLFYLRNGVPVFYWQENFNINAISTYLLCALLSLVVYKLLSYFRNLKNNGKIKVGDKGWVVLSLVLLASIVTLLVM